MPTERGARTRAVGRLGRLGTRGRARHQTDMPVRSNETEEDALHVEIQGDTHECVARAVAAIEPLLHPEGKDFDE